MRKTPINIPFLPPWMKADCVETSSVKPKLDANGDLLVPGLTHWKCETKLSWKIKLGKLVVIPCETPYLFTWYVSTTTTLQGLPVIDVDWSGPLVGTGRNVWHAVDKFSKDFKHILENFIPILQVQNNQNTTNNP